MKSSFKEIVKGDKPVLIDFWATWCGPCIAMAPILKEVAEKVGDKARIIKIDVDKNPELSALYSIQSIPTMMLFKNGEVVWRIAGVQSVRSILDVIEQHTGK